MSWISDVFNLRRAEADEQFKQALESTESLPGEDEHLSLHAEADRRRFGAIISIQKVQYDESKSNKTLLLLIVALLVITKVLTPDMVMAVVKDFL